MGRVVILILLLATIGCKGSKSPAKYQPEIISRIYEANDGSHVFEAEYRYQYGGLKLYTKKDVQAYKVQVQNLLHNLEEAERVLE